MTTDPLELFGAVRYAVLAEVWRGLASLCDEASLEAFADGVQHQFAAPPPDLDRVVDS
jgi:hypothetical protein